MQITINDRQSYAINSQRVYTDEGFLRVPGFASRPGIQTYLASELKLSGNPNRLVNIYRPAEEVFAEDSLKSFLGIDVTNEHPQSLVNAGNYRNTSVGVVTSEGREENGHVVVDMIVKDKSAIDAVERGKVELSVGYTAIYDETSGVTEDGTEYEFVQRSIKCNHIALVQRGRAGTARIFDNNPRGAVSMAIISLDSGRSIDVADSANAQLVADAYDRLQKRVNDADAANKLLTSEKDVLAATADSAKDKIAELEKQCSDEAIKARVEGVAKCIADARKIVGDSFTCDSVDPTEIKRAALKAKRPNIDWADKSAMYVEAAFDMAEEAKADTTVQLAQLAKDSAPVQEVKDAAPVLSRAQQSLLNRTGKGAK